MFLLFVTLVSFVCYSFTCPSCLYSSTTSWVSSQKSVLPTYTWWRCSSVMISIFFIFFYLKSSCCGWMMSALFFLAAQRRRLVFLVPALFSRSLMMQVRAS